MNVGHRNKLTHAIRAEDYDTLTLAAMISRDDPSDRPQPKLPVLVAPYRLLPGESNWPREKIAPKVIE